MSNSLSHPENFSANTYDNSVPNKLRGDADLARPENKLPNSISSDNVSNQSKLDYVDLNTPIPGYPGHTFIDNDGTTVTAGPDGKGGVTTDYKSADGIVHKVDDVYPDGKGGDIVERSGQPNADVTPTKDGGYTVSYTDKNGQPSTEAESYTMTPDGKGGSTYTFKRPDGSVDTTLQSTSLSADGIKPQTGAFQTFVRAALGKQNAEALKMEAMNIESDRSFAKSWPH